MNIRVCYRGAVEHPRLVAVDKQSVVKGGNRCAQSLAALLTKVDPVCNMHQVLAHAFRESRASGRHFSLRPWDYIPIPRYDSASPSHAALTKLTTRAEKIAHQWLATPDAAKLKNAGQSKRIREILTDEGVSAKIHALATKVLPQHCS